MSFLFLARLAACPALILLAIVAETNSVECRRLF